MACSQYTVLYRTALCLTVMCRTVSLCDVLQKKYYKSLAYHMVGVPLSSMNVVCINENDLLYAPELIQVSAHESPVTSHTIHTSHQTPVTRHQSHQSHLPQVTSHRRPRRPPVRP